MEIILSSDCFPFLLLSDKSVVELNRRLKESESDVRVSDLWFRPNISVKDVSAPFVEDEWTYVKGSFTYEVCRGRWRGIFKADQLYECDSDKDEGS